MIAGAITVLLAVVASGHAVLYKRDSRAAVAWVGLIWLVPVLGPILYWLLGINRVRRRAALLRSGRPFGFTAEFERPAALRSEALLPEDLRDLSSLAELVDRVTGRPLTAGNAVTPLMNGDQAFPAMLDAINSAQSTVALATYIFDHDHVGLTFRDALVHAVRRNVAVRVLIDDVGARYSFPSMVRDLARRGVRVARYGPTVLPWRITYFNLRNHRKLLVADGRTGFTGGMNLREEHVLGRSPRHPVQDLHFRLEGPVVRHLTEAFAEDWAFTTGERLTGETWFPELESRGSIYARGITDGPDEDFERGRLVLLGALACARRSVTVVTPYFLPDAALITALTVAAMRGVQVDILLPAVNNLALVHWASTAQLWQVLQRGCRVFYTPPPFDHTKLVLVDEGWVRIGSSNWDARSLRLNFEFDVECYDRAFASRAAALVAEKRQRARQVTARQVDARPLPIKLRDGIARLASPYL